jgi:hypothetical protein
MYTIAIVQTKKTFKECSHIYMPGSGGDGIYQRIPSAVINGLWQGAIIQSKWIDFI